MILKIVYKVLFGILFPIFMISRRTYGILLSKIVFNLVKLSIHISYQLQPEK